MSSITQEAAGTHLLTDRGPFANPKTGMTLKLGSQRRVYWNSFFACTPVEKYHVTRHKVQKQYNRFDVDARRSEADRTAIRT
jgi:hypothetical protein